MTKSIRLRRLAATVILVMAPGLQPGCSYDLDSVAIPCGQGRTCSPGQVCGPGGRCIAGTAPDASQPDIKVDADGSLKDLPPSPDTLQPDTVAWPPGEVWWGTSFGSVGGDAVHGLAADTIGNVYISGFFNGQSMKVGTCTELTGNSNESKIFVASLDQYGSCRWAKTFQGKGNCDDMGLGLVTDNAGTNVYVTGTYLSPVTFGSTTLINYGAKDVFVASLKGDSGDPNWAIGFGSKDLAFSDQGTAIDVDSASPPNVYVTGVIRGQMYLGSTTVGTYSADHDIFVAGMKTSDGSFLWFKSFGTGVANDIVFSEPNIYITGGFAGYIKFTATSLTSLGGNDMFAAMLKASDGDPQSQMSLGDASSEDEGMATAADPATVYITGSFGGSFNQGSCVLNSVGDSDIFVASSSNELTSGSCIGYGGTKKDKGEDLVVDSSIIPSNLYITGTYLGTLTFGSNTFSSSTTKNNIFVAKLDPNKNHIWSKSFGNENDIETNPRLALASGHLYLAGGFAGTMKAGGSTTLTSKGAGDVFVLRLVP